MGDGHLLLGGGAAALLVTQYDMSKKLITYTTPKSVREIIEAKGDGYGISNYPDSGLFVVNEHHPTGKSYPKGTVFWVSKGSIKAVWG